MSSSPRFAHLELYQQPYQIARECYGDIGLSYELFANRMETLIAGHLGPGSEECRVRQLVASLHTSDYYLTGACAERHEAAWRKFYDEFGRFIHGVARFATTSPDIAEEVAGWLLSNLCRPDRSGRMKIDRFDGRASLATWLRVIICHRAINERERRHNSAIPFEDLTDLQDKDGGSRLESGIKDQRYGRALIDSINTASELLTDSERLVLCLRYDEGLKSREIARLRRVHPSTITRQMALIHRKLRDAIVLNLRQRHGFGTDAIEECLSAAVEEPGYRLLLHVDKSLLARPDLEMF